MVENYIPIKSKDCSRLDLPEESLEALRAFNVDAVKYYCFSFKGKYEVDQDSSLVEFNHGDNSWWTTRYVGEAVFGGREKTFRLSIHPRFGEIFLFRMLEEIYNVRLAPSQSKISRTNDLQFLIRKVIVVIWLQLLAAANKHGIPRKNSPRVHKGSGIKGKLDITKTVQSLSRANLITSSYREKSADPVISNIILQAHKILRSDYGLGDAPENAQDALHHFFHAFDPSPITERDYARIVYKDIYIRYKALVDFSWDIIKRKRLQNRADHSSATAGFSFFIDMAEIWELYLKSLLKKRLALLGWRAINPQNVVYSEKFYRRNIIPDIVFKKENEVLVWDAKYKRMYFFSRELDREDFFQIHTYASFYQLDHKVLSAGLLYPVSLEIGSDKIVSHYSKGLFGSQTSNTMFVVDGINVHFLQRKDIGHDEKLTLMKQCEAEFIERVLSAICR